MVLKSGQNGAQPLPYPIVFPKTTLFIPIFTSLSKKNTIFAARKTFAPM
jgi:hypothetical protein